MQSIRHENLKGFLQTSDRKPGGLSFRLKELRTFARFPVSQQGGINYPPAAGWSPFLSRKERRLAFSLFRALGCLPFLDNTIPLHSCNPTGLHGLENLIRFLPTRIPQGFADLRILLGFAPTANNVCGLYPFSPEQIITAFFRYFHRYAYKLSLFFTQFLSFFGSLINYHFSFQHIITLIF